MKLSHATMTLGLRIIHSFEQETLSSRISRIAQSPRGLISQHAMQSCRKRLCKLSSIKKYKSCSTSMTKFSHALSASMMMSLRWRRSGHDVIAVARRRTSESSRTGKYRKRQRSVGVMNILCCFSHFCGELFCQECIFKQRPFLPAEQ